VQRDTGNEDCGEMSAWYVMSAMGFYAVDPISGSYVFGTPLFDKVTIDLGQDRQFDQRQFIRCTWFPGLA
jgi:putative alpha-1,2-mannosidase